MSPAQTAMHNASAYPEMVDTSEVTAAIESLYDDALRPYGRILRKRFGEIAARRGSWPADVDARCLQRACERCPWLIVQAEEGGDWSALLQYRPAAFVDVYSPVDFYPPELWAAAGVYFEGLDEANMVLPGGRYSCAQALQERRLHFLEGRSLGQICHIVQLGISQKKLLGYLNGAVVPYVRSQSMVKERCAERQRPCTNGVRGASNLADWENVRLCLQEILGSLSPSSASIPLSNVKRLFRSRFHIELSETALGHAKLSELFQDSRLRDVCDVRLKGHGYVLVPLRRAAVAMPISIAGNLGLCVERAAIEPIDKDLHSRDICTSSGDIVSHVLPASAQVITATTLTESASHGCPVSDDWAFLQAVVKDAEPSSRLVAAMPTPMRARRAPPPGEPLLAKPGTSPSLSEWGIQVRNTFIHAEMPPSSPMAGSANRARSCPRSMGSELLVQ